MSNFSCREVCSRWTSHLHIPFLFQYDYLGDRRPVPAGLFPYNYPPSPTVHDKMVRPTAYDIPRPPELASLLGPSTPGTPMLTFRQPLVLLPMQDSSPHSELGPVLPCYRVREHGGPKDILPSAGFCPLMQRGLDWGCLRMRGKSSSSSPQAPDRTANCFLCV